MQEKMGFQEEANCWWIPMRSPEESPPESIHFICLVGNHEDLLKSNIFGEVKIEANLSQWFEEKISNEEEIVRTEV